MATDNERADMESLPILTDMYELGQQFIEVEDDPGDEADAATMTGILGQLEGLIEAEATEPNEGPEPEEPGETPGSMDAA
jgi:hypothetical protein